MKFIVMTVQNIQNRNWMKVKKKIKEHKHDDEKNKKK